MRAHNTIEITRKTMATTSLQYILAGCLAVLEQFFANFPLNSRTHPLTHTEHIRKISNKFSWTTCNKDYSRYFVVDAAIKALCFFDAAAARAAAVTVFVVYLVCKAAIRFRVYNSKHTQLLSSLRHTIHAPECLYMCTHLCTPTHTAETSNWNNNKVTHTSGNMTMFDENVQCV